MQVKDEINYDYDRGRPFSLLHADLAHNKDTFVRSNFEYYVFEYIQEGAGTVIIGEKTKFCAQSNDVYILPKYQDHKFYPDHKNVWKKVFFIADGAIIDHLLTAYKLDGVFLYRDCNLNDIFLNILECFYSFVDHDQLNSVSSILFHKIIQLLYQKTTHASQQYSIDVFNIKNALDSNIRNQITLDMICDQLNLSKASVIRKFKAEIGQTPYDYLLSKKLELACKLLCSTSFSIKEIAERLDFTDQYYFSDLFKRKFGLSPKYYRGRAASPNTAY